MHTVKIKHVTRKVVIVMENLNQFLRELGVLSKKHGIYLDAYTHLINSDDKIIGTVEEIDQTQDGEAVYSLQQNHS